MIMKNALILLCLTLTILTNSLAFAQAPALPPEFGPHQWTATVKVVGEDGNPIPDANISLQYSIPAVPNSNGQTYGEVKGITDINGIFSASHTDSSWDLRTTAEKADYYNTHIGYQFYFDDKRRNPTFKLTLKKIGKPVAMYAKHIDSLRVPEFNKAIGYDLIVGDWVGSYGKGINSDLLITEKHADPHSSYILSVSFPNPGDGIQEFDEPLLLQNASNGQSDLRSAQNAPANGYQPEFVQTNYNQNQNFYFRVRTKLDENGNIVSARYGKIYGNLAQFTYYFNPTPNDKNIEFDPKQNLLGGLDPLEQVGAP